MIRNKFCLDDLSQKRHLGHQEGGVTIDDDTGVTLTEFPDIQYDISSNYGLDYIQLQFTNKLRPGNCFQSTEI